MHVHSRRRSGRSEGVRAASSRFALILAVHVAFVIALLQVDPELRRQVVPVLVSIVSAPVQEPPPPPVGPSRELPPAKAVSPKPVQRREAEPTTPPSAITAEPSIVSEATVTSPAPVPADGSPAAPAVEAKAAPTPTPTPTPPAVVPPRFDAAYLNNPRPDYPKAAKRMGEQGKVMLRVLVSVAGAPEKVEIGTSSGSRRLDDAARLAVEQWKFVPARQGDLPVAAWVIVPITFALEG